MILFLSYMRMVLLFYALPLFFLNCFSTKFAKLEQACPKETPKIIELKEYQRCFAQMETLLSFDKSFSNTQEAQEAKKRMIELMTDFFFEPLVWPENNRLLVFPSMKFTQEQICLFVPGQDPKGCHVQLKSQGQERILPLRFIQYILTHIQIFSNEATNHQKDPSDSTVMAEINRMLKQVHVYPSFFKRPRFVQASSILHEAKHHDLETGWHTYCVWLPSKEFFRDCDHSLNGGYGMNLLFSELVLRALVQKERISRKQIHPLHRKEIEMKIATILTFQAEWLMHIENHPLLPKELVSSNEKDALQFVQNNPRLFGFLP